MTLSEEIRTFALKSEGFQPGVSNVPQGNMMDWANRVAKLEAVVEAAKLVDNHAWGEYPRLEPLRQALAALEE